MNFEHPYTELHLTTLREAPYRPRTHRRSAADARAAAIAFAAARDVLG